MIISLEMKRVTITLPDDTVAEIDEHNTNRSHFIQVAVARELEYRRRQEFERSLASQHVETDEVAEAGFEEWVAGGEESDLDLVDVSGGTPVRWQPGRGWIEIDE